MLTSDEMLKAQLETLKMAAGDQHAFSAGDCEVFCKLGSNTKSQVYLIFSNQYD